jgi:predicted GIY-YIG superfamily endonuclease
MFIYVIELEGQTVEGSKRFYIGSTKNVELRYEKHLRGEGSDYTKQFKPKFIVQIYDAGIIEKEVLKYEDEITEKYILLHGIGVRGGHYLTEKDVESFLFKEKHLNNLCYSCGKPGHYSKQCPTLLVPSNTSNSTNNNSNNCDSIQTVQKDQFTKTLFTETDDEKKKRLSSIKVSLWSSGHSKYTDSLLSNTNNGVLEVLFGAQTHANNKNHKVQVGALFCDTSGGGWTIRGIVSDVTFNPENNAFKLIVKPIPESGLSIRTSSTQHGKVGIAKALGLPLPSYSWTSSGIVVHRV